MPPIRRRNPTPPVKARRPKVAGSTNRPSVETEQEAVDATTVEPEKVEKVAAPKPAETKAEPVAVEDAAVEEAAAEPPVVEEPETAVETTDSAVTTESEAASEPVDSVGADVTADGADTPTGTSTRTSRIGWKLVATLGVIAALLGVFALVAVFKPGAQVSNPAWVDTAETQEVSSAARSAIETLYTYKSETVDQDFDKARAVLNKSMLDDFNRTAETTKTAVVQTKTATQAEVTDVGVKVLSDDRAELVASMTVSASNDGVAQGSAQGPLSITMEKVDGKWLLSKIEDQ